MLPDFEIRKTKARYLKVGDTIRYARSPGDRWPFNWEATIVEKRPARRVFSRGKAYDLVLSDGRKIYALDDGIFARQVRKRSAQHTGSR